MIQIKNLNKSYGENVVYENFDFEIEEGKVTCILGGSGSGKTTLLNCIAGLTPYSGEITKLKCGYVFQSPRLVPNLTVEGNLKLVCNDMERIGDMLSRVRLGGKAKSYPVKLSGGEAQRVALARAFLFGGDIMLLDEPFSSLDVKLKKEITDLFFEIWQSTHPTVLFVTHDIDETVSVAHRAVVLRGGKIIFDTSPDGEPPRPFGADSACRSRLISALMS